MSIIAIFLQLCVWSATMPEPIDAVAQAERSFAADSTTLGLNEAFIKHLSDDAWIFRPYPLRAGPWLKKQPHNSATLEWGPQYVDVARSGDLALSIGPWRIGGASADPSKQLYGHFMSVWKRSADGDWKVISDHGIVHPKFDIQAQLVAIHSRSERAAPLTDSSRAARLIQLQTADDDFRKSLQEMNATTAYLRAIAPNALILREGTIPQPGVLPSSLTTAKQGFGAGPRRDAGMSVSGDFGFTVGGDNAPEFASHGVYERVWRFDGNAWRLLADVTTSAE